MTELESGISLEPASIVLGRCVFEPSFGHFEVTFFRDQFQERTAMAIACGDLQGSEPLLARVHSSCLTSECLMACDCDCAEQLERALRAIAVAGRGVVFYLIQEGRGAGLTAKARDRMIVQASRHHLTTFDAYAEMGLPADLRRYDDVAPMARTLGIQGPLELLTNNPEKAADVAMALANEKIDVHTTRNIEGSISPFNLDYLRAKRQSGHALSRREEQAAVLPPEIVRVEPPQRAVEHPHLLSTACYFLPIDLDLETEGQGTVIWFRMRVVYDLRTARESVLLSLGSVTQDHAGAALTMRLVDRLPGAMSEGRIVLRRALNGMRDRRGGVVVVHFDDSNPSGESTAGIGMAPGPELSAEMLSAQWASASTVAGPTLVSRGDGSDVEH